jgi:hypothetical protein
MTSIRANTIRLGISRGWLVKTAITSPFDSNFEVLLRNFFGRFFSQPAIVGMGIALSGVLLHRTATSFLAEIFLQDARLLDWLATKPGFFLKRCRRARRHRAFNHARAAAFLRFRRLRPDAVSVGAPVALRFARQLFRLRRLYRASQPLGISSQTFYRHRSLRFNAAPRFFRRRTSARQIRLTAGLSNLKQVRFFRRRRWFRRMRTEHAINHYKILGRVTRSRRFTRISGRRSSFRVRRLHVWPRARRYKVRRSPKFQRFLPARARSRAFFRHPTVRFNKRFFFRFGRFCRFRGCRFAGRLAALLAYRIFGIPVRVRLNFCGYVGTSEFHLNYITTKLYYRYILNDIIKPIVRLSRAHYRGFRLVCRGRFTRAQMATERVYRFGSVRASSLHVPVDYAQRFVILKYGVCNLKIWLRY